ncbi:MULTISPECIES: hypothetical protein [Asaia]|uniref:Uncharacterized protein n=1 Tax=Asaia bogorensis NBRC 16594 TaxID=1231624 RepID=A0AAN4U488_9PROT|nr:MULTISPECIES: hypothetical protein [Asaia]MDL2171028.1 hypothetical protein [Asaia sp. HumB]MDR6183449.1 hypothetical protein [Asaia bogorensis NBRC 16594]BAT21044.1 hypothetical protein Asbog_02809 [Asaia bogorensis NBRC 16594]GBQ74342.1 hypothetical protein AA0311_0491 [Asaia bogorensis NBRC 16594]GEL54580.1 hypothetical protein ABO01nite_25870 [Asaia bogorensis NBRC 16594]
MSEATPWTDRNGTPIACVEKLKVLRENDTELRQTLQDVFEDALLMGVAPDVMRRHLAGMIDALEELNP